MLRHRKYKKSTIAFLAAFLGFWNTKHTLQQYLSRLSAYAIPQMEEFYASTWTSWGFQRPSGTDGTTYIGIPAVAVERDYYIVIMLEKLAQSPYADSCVFKGGTSLSKCSPGSIERFSEDIDLTFIPQEEMGNKQYDAVWSRLKRLWPAASGLRKSQAREMTVTRVPMYGSKCVNYYWQLHSWISSLYGAKQLLNCGLS